MRRVIRLLNPIVLMGFIWYLSAHMMRFHIRPFVEYRLVPGTETILEEIWDLFLFILIELRVWIGIVFFAALGLLIHIDSIYWDSVDEQDKEVVTLEPGEYRIDMSSIEPKEYSIIAIPRHNKPNLYVSGSILSTGRDNNRLNTLDSIILFSVEFSEPWNTETFMIEAEYIKLDGVDIKGRLQINWMGACGGAAYPTPDKDSVMINHNLDRFRLASKVLGNITVNGCEGIAVESLLVKGYIDESTTIENINNLAFLHFQIEYETPPITVEVLPSETSSNLDNAMILVDENGNGVSISTGTDGITMSELTEWSKRIDGVDSQGRKDYYVSHDGSGMECSRELPCSFDIGIEKVKPGEVIIMMHGDYR